MDDFFTIQLNIADKNYRLNCKRSEEALARKAARRVNETILKYGGHFNNSKIELKDLLAVVAFHFSMYNMMIKEEIDTTQISDKIDELDHLIDDYLNS